MVTYTYDNLINRIKNNAADGEVSDEFTEELPWFIDSAERRLVHDLDTYGFVILTTLQCSASVQLLAKPSGMEFPKSLYILDAAGSTAPVQLKTDEFCRDYWPIAASVSVPRYYAHFDATYFMLAPTPVSTVDMLFQYAARPDPLSTATSVNWLTQYAGDALFFACMVEASLFQKNREAAEGWNTRYMLEKDKLLNRDRRNRQDDQGVPASPAGADNPLVRGSN